MEVCTNTRGPGDGWSAAQTAGKAREKCKRMGDGPRWWVDRVRNRRRTRDLAHFLIRLRNGVQLRIGLIRIGNGQHAVWMHSALPRLGFIPLGCRTGGRAWNTWQTTARSLIQVQRELAQKAIQNDQESVCDTVFSLKGPPAVHGSL